MAQLARVPGPVPAAIMRNRIRWAWIAWHALRLQLATAQEGKRES
jgi:hypothetical protein